MSWMKSVTMNDAPAVIQLNLTIWSVSLCNCCKTTMTPGHSPNPETTTKEQRKHNKKNDKLIDIRKKRETMAIIAIFNWFSHTESLITGLWQSWWYNDVHFMHSMRRFFALKSMRWQITHTKSSKKLLWMFASIALSSSVAIDVADAVSGNEIITGISCGWPVKSVVNTVVVDDELVVTAIICTGLELLESLDLCDKRRTDACTMPLPVALLSSAIYFLLSVLMSILLGPCFWRITSSSAFRIFSAASLFDECKNRNACRNTGSKSTLAAIFSTFNTNLFALSLFSFFLSKCSLGDVSCFFC